MFGFYGLSEKSNSASNQSMKMPGWYRLKRKDVL